MTKTLHGLDELHIRDACVLPDEDSGQYIMVGSLRGPWPPQPGQQRRTGVVAYTSQDLVGWEGPRVIWEAGDDFWAHNGVWAPEIHRYKGRHYLFLTFNTDIPIAETRPGWLPYVQRGSQVLVGDDPLGPFKPFANHAHLPANQMTLDGTLWVEDGVPYMVYCHEWVQMVDGTVEAIQLKDDLSATVGEPTVLFHGSDASWATESRTYPGCYVTDGCFLYRSETGELLMLWSGFITGSYTVGVARSETGKLAGPWVQQAEPVYTNDGGHPMVFRAFDGRLMLVLHQPNQPPNERARLFELEDLGDSVRIVRPV